MARSTSLVNELVRDAHTQRGHGHGACKSIAEYICSRVTGSKLISISPRGQFLSTIGSLRKDWTNHVATLFDNDSVLDAGRDQGFGAYEGFRNQSLWLQGTLAENPKDAKSKDLEKRYGIKISIEAPIGFTEQVFHDGK